MPAFGPFMDGDVQQQMQAEQAGMVVVLPLLRSASGQVLPPQQQLSSADAGATAAWGKVQMVRPASTGDLRHSAAVAAAAAAANPLTAGAGGQHYDPSFSPMPLRPRPGAAAAGSRATARRHRSNSYTYGGGPELWGSWLGPWGGYVASVDAPAAAGGGGAGGGGCGVPLDGQGMWQMLPPPPPSLQGVLLWPPSQQQQVQVQQMHQQHLLQQQQLQQQQQMMQQMMQQQQLMAPPFTPPPQHQQRQQQAVQQQHHHHHHHCNPLDAGGAAHVPRPRRHSVCMGNVLMGNTGRPPPPPPAAARSRRFSGRYTPPALQEMQPWSEAEELLFLQESAGSGQQQQLMQHSSPSNALMAAPAAAPGQPGSHGTVSSGGVDPDALGSVSGPATTAGPPPLAPAGPPATPAAAAAGVGGVQLHGRHANLTNMAAAEVDGQPLAGTDPAAEVADL
jgi:hypothetical protein